jgi:hypothetical protein
MMKSLEERYYAIKLFKPSLTEQERQDIISMVEWRSSEIVQMQDLIEAYQMANYVDSLHLKKDS